MISWFSCDAPIRTKFRVLAALHVLICAGLAALLGAAALGIMTLSPIACVAIGAAGIVAAGALTMTASRLICTPYVTTVLRMEALAAGDLDSPVLYTHNRDCVGRMTKAMASFRESALAARERDAQKQMALVMGEGLARLAKGDLTARIEVDLPEPFLTLRNDFNQAVAALHGTLSSVAAAVEAIRRGAGEISAASDDLAQRTEQHAASLEETAAAMEQITSTVRDTAGAAGQADRIVGTTRSEALESGDVVRRAMDAMAGIEHASTEISDIIAVIDGIAFQTNLLALNAGVEAARAGEAGKGFAVVASEVRALAQRSADAAKDVKQRITASVRTVDAGVSLVSETGRSLDRIVGRIGEISTLVSDISGAADQQAQGLQQVNTAVSEMDGVTQRNAAMVEQATAAARSLANEADALSMQIARFDLGAATNREAGASAYRIFDQEVARARQTAGARAFTPSPALAVANADWAEF